MGWVLSGAASNDFYLNEYNLMILNGTALMSGTPSALALTGTITVTGLYPGICEHHVNIQNGAITSGYHLVKQNGDTTWTRVEQPPMAL